MKLHLSLIVAILTLSCRTKTNQWQTLDFGSFKIKAPQGWKMVKEHGIDSYVGGLTNGKDSLWFDYGMYGLNLSGRDTMDLKFAKDTINGLNAWITIPKKAGKGYISVHIPKVSGEDQFTIWGEDIKETDTILKMYKSLVFENSDTAINPPLTENKYILLSHGSGRTIYEENCAGCHSFHKIMTGPPFYDIINKRTATWIYKFITDSTWAAYDTAHISMRRQYGYHCIKFPDLTKSDVELLVDYIRSR